MITFFDTENINADVKYVSHFKLFVSMEHVEFGCQLIFHVICLCLSVCCVLTSEMCIFEIGEVRFCSVANRQTIIQKLFVPKRNVFVIPIDQNYIRIYEKYLHQNTWLCSNLTFINQILF